MSYLIQYDYEPFYDLAQLSNLTDTVDALRVKLELNAQEYAASFLLQRFDMAREFNNTSQYDPTKTYGAISNVYLNANPYASGTKTANISLALGTDGYVYVSKTGVDNDPSSNGYPDDWQQLGLQWQFFNGIIPNPEWDWRQNYLIDSIVWYKGKNYTALQEGWCIAPDDPINGATYWGTGTAYTIAANTLLDTTKWQLGDLRCQKLVEVCCMFVLYNLWKRAPAANVPEWVAIAQKDSEDWCRDVMKGNITTPLVELPRDAGARIRITGNVKNINIY